MCIMMRIPIFQTYLAFSFSLGAVFDRSPLTFGYVHALWATAMSQAMFTFCSP